MESTLRLLKEKTLQEEGEEEARQGSFSDSFSVPGAIQAVSRVHAAAALQGVHECSWCFENRHTEITFRAGEKKNLHRKKKKKKKKKVSSGVKGFERIAFELSIAPDVHDTA